MNKRTIALLSGSFAEIVKRKPDVAALFYQRLFEVAPAVKPLFKSSPKQQQRKLTASLAQIVASLEQPDKLAAHLNRLGARHAAYGTQPAHYKVVGDVLMWTFEQVLEQDFTKDVRAAWMTAYDTVAKVMKAAAKQARAKPARAPKAKLALVESKPVRRKASKSAARTASSARSAAVGGKRKAARRPVRKSKTRAR